MYEILFAVIVLALLASIIREVRRAADAVANRPDRDEGAHELLIKLNRTVGETNALLRRIAGAQEEDQNEAAEHSAGGDS